MSKLNMLNQEENQRLFAKFLRDQYCEPWAYASVIGCADDDSQLGHNRLQYLSSTPNSKEIFITIKACHALGLTRRRMDSLVTSEILGLLVYISATVPFVLTMTVADAITFFMGDRACWYGVVALVMFSAMLTTSVALTIVRVRKAHAAAHEAQQTLSAYLAGAFNQKRAQLDSGDARDYVTAVAGALENGNELINQYRKGAAVFADYYLYGPEKIVREAAKLNIMSNDELEDLRSILKTFEGSAWILGRSSVTVALKLGSQASLVRTTAVLSTAITLLGIARLALNKSLPHLMAGIASQRMSVLLAGLTSITLAAVAAVSNVVSMYHVALRSRQIAKVAVEFTVYNSAIRHLYKICDEQRAKSSGSSTEAMLQGMLQVTETNCTLARAMNALYRYIDVSHLEIKISTLALSSSERGVLLDIFNYSDIRGKAKLVGQVNNAAVARGHERVVRMSVLINELYGLAVLVCLYKIDNLLSHDRLQLGIGVSAVVLTILGIIFHCLHSFIITPYFENRQTAAETVGRAHYLARKVAGRSGYDWATKESAAIYGWDGVKNLLPENMSKDDIASCKKLYEFLDDSVQGSHGRMLQGKIVYNLSGSRLSGAANNTRVYQFAATVSLSALTMGIIAIDSIEMLFDSDPRLAALGAVTLAIFAVSILMAVASSVIYARFSADQRGANVRAEFIRRAARHVDFVDSFPAKDGDLVGDSSSNKEEGEVADLIRDELRWERVDAILSSSITDEERKKYQRWFETGNDNVKGKILVSALATDRRYEGAGRYAPTVCAMLIATQCVLVYMVPKLLPVEELGGGQVARWCAIAALAIMGSTFIFGVLQAAYSHFSERQCTKERFEVDSQAALASYCCKSNWQEFANGLQQDKDMVASSDGADSKAEAYVNINNSVCESFIEHLTGRNTPCKW